MTTYKFFTLSVNWVETDFVVILFFTNHRLKEGSAGSEDLADRFA
jgi:hypothetical protein